MVWPMTAGPISEIFGLETETETEKSNMLKVALRWDCGAICSRCVLFAQNLENKIVVALVDMLYCIQSSVLKYASEGNN